jgi:hypothetical protein
MTDGTKCDVLLFFVDGLKGQKLPVLEQVSLEVGRGGLQLPVQDLLQIFN